MAFKMFSRNKGGAPPRHNAESTTGYGSKRKKKKKSVTEPGSLVYSEYVPVVIDGKKVFVSQEEAAIIAAAEKLNAAESFVSVEESTVYDSQKESSAEYHSDVGGRPSDGPPPLPSSPPPDDSSQSIEDLQKIETKPPVEESGVSVETNKLKKKKKSKEEKKSGFFQRVFSSDRKPKVNAKENELPVSEEVYHCVINADGTRSFVLASELARIESEITLKRDLETFKSDDNRMSQGVESFKSCIRSSGEVTQYESPIESSIEDAADDHPTVLPPKAPSLADIPGTPKELLVEDWLEGQSAKEETKLPSPKLSLVQSVEDLAWKEGEAALQHLLTPTPPQTPLEILERLPEEIQVAEIETERKSRSRKKEKKSNFFQRTFSSERKAKKKVSQLKEISNVSSDADSEISDSDNKDRRIFGATRRKKLKKNKNDEPRIKREKATSSILKRLSGSRDSRKSSSRQTAEEIPKALIKDSFSIGDEGLTFGELEVESDKSADKETEQKPKPRFNIFSFMRSKSDDSVRPKLERPERKGFGWSEGELRQSKQKELALQGEGTYFEAIEDPVIIQQGTIQRDLDLHDKPMKRSFSFSNLWKTKKKKARKSAEVQSLHSNESKGESKVVDEPRSSFVKILFGRNKSGSKVNQKKHSKDREETEPSKTGDGLIEDSLTVKNKGESQDKTSGEPTTNRGAASSGDSSVKLLSVRPKEIDEDSRKDNESIKQKTDKTLVKTNKKQQPKEMMKLIGVFGSQNLAKSSSESEKEGVPYSVEDISFSSQNELGEIKKAKKAKKRTFKLTPKKRAAESKNKKDKDRQRTEEKEIKDILGSNGFFRFAEPEMRERAPAALSCEELDIPFAEDSSTPPNEQEVAEREVVARPLVAPPAPPKTQDEILEVKETPDIELSKSNKASTDKKLISKEDKENTINKLQCTIPDLEAEPVTSEPVPTENSSNPPKVELSDQEVDTVPKSPGNKSILSIFGSREMKKPKKAPKEQPKEKIDNKPKQSILSMFGSRELKAEEKTKNKAKDESETEKETVPVEVTDDKKSKNEMKPKKSILSIFGSKGELETNEKSKPKKKKKLSRTKTDSGNEEISSSDDEKDKPKISLLSMLGSREMKPEDKTKPKTKKKRISKTDSGHEEISSSDEEKEIKPKKTILSLFGSKDEIKTVDKSKSPKKKNLDSKDKDDSGHVESNSSEDEKDTKPKKSLFSLFGSKDLGQKPDKNRPRKVSEARVETEEDANVKEPSKGKSILSLFGSKELSTTHNSSKESDSNNKKKKKVIKNLDKKPDVSHGDLVLERSPSKESFSSDVSSEKEAKGSYDVQKNHFKALELDKVPRRSSATSRSSADSAALIISSPIGKWGPKSRSQILENQFTFGKGAYSFVGEEPEKADSDTVVLRSFKILDDNGNTLVKGRRHNTYKQRPASYHEALGRRNFTLRPESFYALVNTASDTESADHGSTDKSSVSKLTQDSAKKSKFSLKGIMRRSKERAEGIEEGKTVADVAGNVTSSPQEGGDPQGDKVVYAELDIVRGADASMRRDNDPDKTEYAEIIHPNPPLTKKEELRKSRENLADIEQELTTTPDGKKEAAV